MPGVLGGGGFLDPPGSTDSNGELTGRHLTPWEFFLVIISVQVNVKTSWPMVGVGGKGVELSFKA